MSQGRYLQKRFVQFIVAAKLVLKHHNSIVLVITAYVFVGAPLVHLESRHNRSAIRLVMDLIRLRHPTDVLEQRDQ